MTIYKNSKSLALLPALLAALLVSSCGYNEDDPVTAPTTPVVADPDPSGLGKDSNGNYANADGFYPNAAGKYPNSRGQYPNAAGVYPTDAEAGIFENDAGFMRSFSTTGSIDTNNIFFKPLGNGRSCASCHAQEDGFTVNPASLEKRFTATNGTDPIFALNDGANSPNADISTLAAKRIAFSMLLSKGLIRVGMPMPTQTNDTTPGAVQFALDAVDDPHGFASSTELSLFRRVLPAANLKFNAAVMWDGRETLSIPYDVNYVLAAKDYCLNITNTTPKPCFAPLADNLKRQANGAVTGHAAFEAGLTEAEQQEVLDFEMSLFAAQEYDNKAKFLASANAKAGAAALPAVDFYFDINGFTDPKTGVAGNKLTTMSMFTTWQVAPGSKEAAVIAARASISRGEAIFNTKTFTMVGVAGTNGTTVTNASCTNCHKAPQTGSLSVPNLFNIGTADPTWNPRAADMPLYTLRNVQTTSSNFGKIVTTTDPAQALITGKWADIGKVKTPQLRGLAGRAPYFHNGSAKTIEETTDFYIRRFNMVMTQQEIDDLNAFLRSL